MPRFLPLTVTDIRKTIRDAVVVTLEPDDPASFAFTQGQYLTLRRFFGDTELRRNYSICTGIDDGSIQIGIKRVEGGAFSTWANTELKPGERLEAMPPSGRFFVPLMPGMARHYLGISGGSGITPVLSILRTVMNREPLSAFTLVYANRSVGTIMLREELEDLKNRFLDRLNVIHILESDSQDIDLFTGRIDAEKCGLLFRHWIDLEYIDTAFVCGPQPMMDIVKAALESHDLDKDRIKFELFRSGQPGRLPKMVTTEDPKARERGCRATVTLDGRTRSFRIPRDGTKLLDAFNAHSMDAPYACRAGVCSTCRAKVVEGEVEMVSNHALEDYEVRAGYLLTCQSVPLGDRIVIDYDQ